VFPDWRNRKFKAKRRRSKESFYSPQRTTTLRPTTISCAGLLCLNVFGKILFLHLDIKAKTSMWNFITLSNLEENNRRHQQWTKWKWGFSYSFVD